MLEIIALYFIFREAGRLAGEKGYAPLSWRIQAFLAWFAGELTGVAVAHYYFPQQLYVMLIIGICMAYLFYLLLKQHWISLPYKTVDHEE